MAHTRRKVALMLWVIVVALIYLVTRRWELVILIGGPLALFGTLFMAGLRDVHEAGDAGRNREAREHEIRQRIGAMSIEDARREALGLLQDASQFHCEHASDHTPAHLDEMAPQLQAFCMEFSAVEGCLYYFDSEVRKSEFTPGYIHIADPYGDGHTEFAALPNEETIYFIDSEQPLPAQPERFAPTIWHCIVLHAELCLD